MLKFVVTKKTEKSKVLKKKLLKVAKTLTPTKKMDKIYTNGDSPIISSLEKYKDITTPLTPTSSANEIIRKHEKAIRECNMLFQSVTENSTRIQAHSKEGLSSSNAHLNVSFTTPGVRSVDCAEEVMNNTNHNSSFLCMDSNVLCDENQSLEKTDKISGDESSDASRINMDSKIHKITENSSLDMNLRINSEERWNSSWDKSKFNVDSNLNKVNGNPFKFSVDSPVGDLSIHMQLYENQFKRIKGKSEKLRARDGQIKEKYEAVCRKAKQFIREEGSIKINDTLNDLQTLVLEDGFLTPVKHQSCVKETFKRDVLDDMCVAIDKTSRRKHHSSSSPKRLQRKRRASAVPRLTSPLARGAKNNFSSTRDLIMRALSKDSREFTFC